MTDLRKLAEAARGGVCAQWFVENAEEITAALAHGAKLAADLNAAHSKIEGMIECHGQLHKARPEGVQCVCEEML